MKKKLKEICEYCLIIIFALVSGYICDFVFPESEPRKRSLRYQSFLGVIGFFSILSIIVYAGLKKKDPPK